MNDAKTYPIDIAELKKGDTITIPELEKITHQEYGSVKFSLAFLALKQFIENGFYNERDEVVTVRTEHGALHICTDAEAVDHVHARQRILHE